MTRDILGETGAEAEQALLALHGLADPLPRPVRVFDEDPADDRPESWEDHEYPGYDAAADPDWPIITTDPQWLARTRPDWLEQGRLRYGVIEPGRYAVEILSRGIRQIATQKTSGVSFLVGILGGDHAGCECRLSFLAEGPDSIVRRDLGILRRWGTALGIDRTRDILDHAVQLGRAGKGHRVMLGIASREMRNGAIDLYAVSVDVEGGNG